MNIKKIVQILGLFIILLNFFGIIIILSSSFLFENIYVDEIAIDLVIIVFTATLILTGIAFFWIYISNKYVSIPSILLFIVMSSQIFMLLYNSIVYQYFWFNGIGAIPEIQFISILTIIISFYTGFLIWVNKLPSDKKDLLLNNLIKISNPLLFGLGSIWAYFPIIAGILYSMVLMFPIAYISWIIFQLPGSAGWVDTYIVIPEYDPYRLIIILLATEICIFLIGFLLFLFGLFYLSKGKKRGDKIVKTGPYNFIRHPQNLAILIMLFPFTLYNPFYNDIGIRIGDILSWTLLCMIIIIYSDVEEINLKKKFPEEFINFQSKTGFFFPKFRHKNLKYAQYQEKNYLKRYFFLIISYCLFILLAYIIVQNLQTTVFFAQFR